MTKLIQLLSLLTAATCLNTKGWGRTPGDRPCPPPYCYKGIPAPIPPTTTTTTTPRTTPAPTTSKATTTIGIRRPRLQLLEEFKGLNLSTFSLGESKVYPIDDREATLWRAARNPLNSTLEEVEEAEASRQFVGMEVQPSDIMEADDQLSQRLRNLSRPFTADFQVPEAFKGQDKARMFHAYDCSKPSNVETVYTSADMGCRLTVKTTDAYRAEFLLLQKASYSRIPTKRCRVLRTTIPMYCGNADHQTLAAHHFRLREPIAVSSHECWKMYQGEYNVTRLTPESKPYTQTFKVTPNATTHVSYSYLGRTWGGVKQREVECKGYDWYTGTNKLGDMTILFYDEVTLDEDTLLIDVDGGMATHISQRTLVGCQVQQHHCRSGDHTYVWTTSKNHQHEFCHLYKTRSVKGMVLTTDDGRKSFVSDKVHMVKLVIKGTTSECGRTVYKTNYRKLFLSDHMEEPLFNRALNVAEFSVLTYTNQQDDFLYHSITDYIRKSLQKALYNDCKDEQAERQYRYEQLAAEQKAAKDGATIHLGGLLFATAAGEVWHTYHCKPIVVQAMHADTCYAGLPIQLQREHEMTFLYHAGKRVDEGTGTNFFLIPHSHRISTVAVPRPCTPHFHNIYQNILGDWIAATPMLTEAPAPRELVSDKTIVELAEAAPVYDFQRGGIYTEDDLMKFDQLQQAPRLTTALTTRIAQQANLDQMGQLSLQNLFPNYTPPPISYTSWIWSFIELYGSVMSGFVGTFLLGRIVTWAIGIMLRCFQPPTNSTTCLSHFLAVLFPTLYTLLMGQPHPGPQTQSADTTQGERQSGQPPVVNQPTTTEVPSAPRRSLLRFAPGLIRGRQGNAYIIVPQKDPAPPASTMEMTTLATTPLPPIPAIRTRRSQSRRSSVTSVASAASSTNSARRRSNVKRATLKVGRKPPHPSQRRTRRSLSRSQASLPTPPSSPAPSLGRRGRSPSRKRSQPRRSRSASRHGVQERRRRSRSQRSKSMHIPVAPPMPPTPHPRMYPLVRISAPSSAAGYQDPDQVRIGADFAPQDLQGRLYQELQSRVEARRQRMRPTDTEDD